LTCDFFTPAQQSVIPVLVADEHLVSANALGSQVNDVSRLAGSAAGGVLAAAGGISALTLTDAASFLLAAVLLARLPLARRESTAAPTMLRERLAGLRGEWADGLRVAVREHTLRVVLIFLAVTCVGEGIMGTLFAPFVRSVLHGSGPDYGFVVSAQAVGGIAGGLIAAALGSRARPALLFGWGAVAFGLVDLVLFLYPLAYVALWPAVVCKPRRDGNTEPRIPVTRSSAPAYFRRHCGWPDRVLRSARNECFMITEPGQ
jgi:predicted MFS family arabinose efflux permease